MAKKAQKKASGSSEVEKAPEAPKEQPADPTPEPVVEAPKKEVKPPAPQAKDPALLYLNMQRKVTSIPVKRGGDLITLTVEPGARVEIRKSEHTLTVDTMVRRRLLKRIK